MANSYRAAFEPPTTDLTPISAALIDAAADYSRTSPRGRVIQPFHKTEADPLHRMLNVVQPHSYVRPHRHLDPPKAEAWVMLRGAAAFFTFDDDGAIRDCLRIAATGELLGVDLAPGIYHSFVALEPDTVIYEVKTGPYIASNDKSFASWAPAEGSADAEPYRQRLLAAFRERCPHPPA